MNLKATPRLRSLTCVTTCSWPPCLKGWKESDYGFRQIAVATDKILARPPSQPLKRRQRHAVDCFMSDDLQTVAFKEAGSWCKGTRCKKYLFSASAISPPKDAGKWILNVFDDTIDAIEKQLNLMRPAEAVCLHEKSLARIGVTRRHCRVVWEPQNWLENMKAIPRIIQAKAERTPPRNSNLETWMGHCPRALISPRFRDHRKNLRP